MFTPADEMHPTHPTHLLHLSPHSSVLQRGMCFTDWKGAYAYASQAVLALRWQLHCIHWIAGQLFVSSLHGLDVQQPLFAKHFSRPAHQCLLFVKKMHLPKQTILAPSGPCLKAIFVPIFVTGILITLNHHKTDSAIANSGCVILCTQKKQLARK